MKLVSAVGRKAGSSWFQTPASAQPSAQLDVLVCKKWIVSQVVAVVNHVLQNSALSQRFAALRCHGHIYAQVSRIIYQASPLSQLKVSHGN
jgi:hypothetical protein